MTTLPLNNQDVSAIVAGNVLHSMNNSQGIIVDLFAGGGGASTGIELALGRHVDIAINHDPDAVLMHKANHPHTMHLCEDVFKVKPQTVMPGRVIDLLWASPDCKHFSRAKGGKPKDKHIRGLAWIIPMWCKYRTVNVVIMENVPEFLGWGPLDPITRQPIKEKEGKTFERFISTMRNLGYSSEWRELTAADYGAPTKRKRLFIVFRKDGQPIVWPIKTHAPRGKTKPGQKEWIAASTVIDFKLPCVSIFERNKDLAIPTMKRIARGLQKFVLDNPKPFIIQSGGSGKRCDDKDSPLNTIVSKNDFCLIKPKVAPLPIVPIGYGESEKQAPRIHELGEPMPTVVSSGKHYLPQAIFSPYIYINNFENKGVSVESPVPTVTTSETKNRLVATMLTPFISKNFGGFYSGSGDECRQPTSTITSVDHNRLIVPTLMDFQFIENPTRRLLRLDEPHPTIAAQGQHTCISQTLLSPFINKYDWYDNVNDIREPMSTILTDGYGKMGLTEPMLQKLTADFIVNQFGTSTASSSKEPLHTCTAKNKYSTCQVAIVQFDGKNDMGHWNDVRKFLNEFAGYELKIYRFTAVPIDEVLLLKIENGYYYIRDIAMRMLTPRELYDAQGFPHDYIIDRDYEGKAYSKAKQIARCGNSVPPPFAEALVRANLPQQATKTKLPSMSKLQDYHEQMDLFADYGHEVQQGA